MSEARKPAAQRRGPVQIQHPLEAAIDPETGDPVDTQAGKPPRAKREQVEGEDRFGLVPVGKGWFRGQITNVRRRQEVTPIGNLVTYTFDVISSRDQPPLLVEMVGYSFSKEIRGGIVVQTYVGDSVPTERIRYERLVLSYDDVNYLQAYMPVQKWFGKVRNDWKFGIIVLLTPIMVICTLIYLAWLRFHVP
jgi:hypothetical protein